MSFIKVTISQCGKEAVFGLSETELKKLRIFSNKNEGSTMGHVYNFSMYAFFEYETSRSKYIRFASLFNYHNGPFIWYIDDI